jgi:hypothetical protein
MGVKMQTGKKAKTKAKTPIVEWMLDSPSGGAFVASAIALGLALLVFFGLDA